MSFYVFKYVWYIILRIIKFSRSKFVFSTYFQLLKVTQINLKQLLTFFGEVWWIFKLTTWKPRTSNATNPEVPTSKVGICILKIYWRSRCSKFQVRTSKLGFSRIFSKFFNVWFFQKSYIHYKFFQTNFVKVFKKVMHVVTWSFAFS